MQLTASVWLFVVWSRPTDNIQQTLATGLHFHTATTDSDGEFVYLQLRPGSRSLVIEISLTRPVNKYLAGAGHLLTVSVVSSVVTDVSGLLW